MSDDDDDGVQHLFAWYAEWVEGHGKVLEIIMSSSAIVSMISSFTLIWMVLKSPKRLSTTYHRLIMGMAIGDIVFSLASVGFGAMTPIDMSYSVWNARGNQATCNLQGFLTLAGLMLTMLYSCSLNIYTLAIVKYNKTDRYIRTKPEPFLHGVPIFLAMVFGITFLFVEGYNAGTRGICSSPTYDPPHCYWYDDGEVREGFTIPCGRGRDGPAEVMFYGVAAFLFLGTPIIVGVTLGIIFRDISQQEQRMNNYGVGALDHSAPQENADTDTAANGGRSSRSTMKSVVSSVKSIFGRLWSRSNRNQTNSSSRAVAHRALAYSVAYILTWSWYICLVIFLAVGLDAGPDAIDYFVSIFTPLQGFWNLVIFVYPKVMRAKRSQGGNVSWCYAIAKVFCPTRVGNTKKAPNNALQKNPAIEEVKTENLTYQQGSTELGPSRPAHAARSECEEEKTEIQAYELGDTELEPSRADHVAHSECEEEKTEIKAYQ